MASTWNRKWIHKSAAESQEIRWGGYCGEGVRTGAQRIVHEAFSVIEFMLDTTLSPEWEREWAWQVFHPTERGQTQQSKCGRKSQTGKIWVHLCLVATEKLGSKSTNGTAVPRAGHYLFQYEGRSKLILGKNGYQPTSRDGTGFARGGERTKGAGIFGYKLLS